MKKVIPERVQRCFYEVEESQSGSGYYWTGWCEGDKDGERFSDNEPLTLKPEHFIGITITETVPTCPNCGQVVEMNKRNGYFYCNCQ